MKKRDLKEIVAILKKEGRKVLASELEKATQKEVDSIDHPYKKKIKKGGGPMNRFGFKPTPGVQPAPSGGGSGATASLKQNVSLIIPIHEGKILIQKRPEGVFGLFGGHSQRRENNVNCACREFFEETGQKIRPNSMKIVGKSKNISFFHLNCTRKFHVYKNEETTDHKWVGKERLRSMKLMAKFRKELPFISKILSKNGGIV